MVYTNVSCPKRVIFCVVLGKKIEPRSKKERRYINERIGISLISTLRHRFLSCSEVRVGGGGKDDSPPKSTLISEEELFRFSFSSFSDGECPFSSDMVEDRSRLGKRSIRRKEFQAWHAVWKGLGYLPKPGFEWHGESLFLFHRRSHRNVHQKTNIVGDL